MISSSQSYESNLTNRRHWLATSVNFWTNCKCLMKSPKAASRQAQTILQTRCVRSNRFRYRSTIRQESKASSKRGTITLRTRSKTASLNGLVQTVLCRKLLKEMPLLSYLDSSGNGMYQTTPMCQSTSTISARSTPSSAKSKTTSNMRTLPRGKTERASAESRQL